MVNSDLYDNSSHYNYFDRRKNDYLEISTFLFLCVVIALVGYGLVTLYSASYDEALKNGVRPAYYLIRQTFFALAGFAVFTLIAFVPLRFIKVLIFPFLVGTLFLMVLTLATPFGVVKMGARRWLQIGSLPSFQVSELLKVATVLFLANIFSKEEKVSTTLLIAIITLFVGSALILLQRDYSTTLVYVLVGLGMLLVAGLSFRYILMFSSFIGVSALAFLLIEPYRIKRVVSFIFPSIDPTGLNWQTQNALKAISEGGVFGKGLGKGIYKLGPIPEVHSDFIFASLMEEGGLVGFLILFFLFAVFAYIGFYTSRKLKNQGDLFGSYATFGITFMIIWQALINIAVVSSLLPPTGIPLPFFSQGGTNLFMVIGECGLLYSFMKKGQKE